MKLSEILEYCAGQYLDDRTDLVEGDPDSLWSDEFLIRQFNEAQRRLARDAWCIIKEGEAACGRIALVTGKAVYDLHPSILRVLLATPSDQEWPLGRTSDARLRTPRVFNTEEPLFDINNLSASAPGRPIAFSTDAGTRQIRFFRTPSSTENGLAVNLKVARKVLVPLSIDKLDDEPEVPEDYHYALAAFAAGRALTLPNVDGQMKADGRALLAEFDTACKEARRDRQRAEMEPATWGFSSVTALLGRSSG